MDDQTRRLSKKLTESERSYVRELLKEYTSFRLTSGKSGISASFGRKDAPGSRDVYVIRAVQSDPYTCSSCFHTFQTRGNVSPNGCAYCLQTD